MSALDIIFSRRKGRLDALNLTKEVFYSLTSTQQHNAWRQLQREWDRLRLNLLPHNAGRNHGFWTLQQAVTEGRMAESAQRFIDQSV